MRLGPYELLAPVASGGTADVFIALRDGATEPCILKRVHEEVAADPSMQQRFWREAEVAALLDHDNIAHVLDAGREDGRFFLAMELVWGLDLAVLIKSAAAEQAPLPVPVAVAIASPLLDALGYAHELADPNGAPLALVHRDVSARNVLVTLDGHVKLIDFGMARAKVGTFRTTARRFIGGTPRYMSPEQALGRDVDLRSDLYSVGVLLHELLTGQRLVKDGDLDEVLKHVARTRPKDVCAVRPEVPRALGDVVKKALARYPADRFESAAQMRAAIDAAGVAPAPAEALAAQVAPHAGELEARRTQIAAKTGGRPVGIAPAETRAAPGGGPSPTGVTPLVVEPGAMTSTAAEAPTPIDEPTAIATDPSLGEAAYAPTAIRAEPELAMPTQVRPPTESVAPRAKAASWAPWLAGAAAVFVIAFTLSTIDRAETPAPPAAAAARDAGSAPAPVVAAPIATPDPEPVPEPKVEPAPPPKPKRVRKTRRRTTTVAKTRPKPPPVVPPPPPPPAAAKPPDVDQLIRRVRGVRTKLAKGSPERAKADDLLSELMVLRVSGAGGAQAKKAARELAALERAVRRP